MQNEWASTRDLVLHVIEYAQMCLINAHVVVSFVTCPDVHVIGVRGGGIMIAPVKIDR